MCLQTNGPRYVNSRATDTKGEFMSNETIPTGLCQCGCGGQVEKWKKNAPGRGQIRGEFKRFLHGHNSFRDLRTRFWAKVNVQSPEECWEWQGSKRGGNRTPIPYGEIRVSNTKTLRAHRVAYELSVGPIPDGMSICHSCDNPLCVNPNHLWAGTHKDNMRDMAQKGRYRIHKNNQQKEVYGGQ